MAHSTPSTHVLTLIGGILTVADDLLKNDGKKFIEMMEQLAERRMQREEEAHYAAAGLRHSSMPIHNHPPPIDDDEFEDEEDDEFDSQDDDEYDEDEMVCDRTFESSGSLTLVGGHDRRPENGRGA